MCYTKVCGIKVIIGTTSNRRINIAFHMKEPHLSRHIARLRSGAALPGKSCRLDLLYKSAWDAWHAIPQSRANFGKSEAEDEEFYGTLL